MNRKASTQTADWTYNANNELLSLPVRYIINQKTVYLQMMRMRYAALLCWLQILMSVGRVWETRPTTVIVTDTYDQVGNRMTSAVATGDWTYNANNELLSTPLSSSGTTGGSSYVYDANGNTIQKNDNGKIQNYVYDVDNRLIEVKDASNNTIAKYTYDPFGRRIKKTVSPAGGGQGVEVYYLYSDEGLIGEYDASGAEIKTYGYKPNSTWSTDPLFMRESGNIYFYHNDHLGTPQKLTNISGAVVWSATYDAFGKATIDASSTITSNLRFPGQYFDAETGLHYNWHRYYDPNTGRYVTEDPIGFDGGDFNLYTYVKSNPVNYVDPLGERVSVFTRSLDMKKRTSGSYVHCVLIVEKCDGRKETWDFQSDNEVYSPAKVPSNPIKNPKTTIVYSENDKDDLVSLWANNLSHPSYSVTKYNCCHWVADVLSRSGIPWKNPNPWPAN